LDEREDVRRYGDFTQLLASRLLMAAQQVPPERQDRSVTAGSGVFGIIAGVI
jgi:hypothetical protein